MNNNINNTLPDEETRFDFGLDDILRSATDSLVETPEGDPIIDLSQNVFSMHGENIVNNREPEVKPSVQVTKNESPGKYNEDVYGTALSLMKEIGLFDVPDNIDVTDEDIWNGVIQDNRERYKQSILNELRQHADPKVTELFDYAYNGGSWFGAEQMIETIQNEIDIAALDPSLDEHARYLIENYLTDGLDPQNPAHARRLGNIENEVMTYFDRLESEDIAREAKDYFLDKIEMQKHYLAEQQQEHLYHEQQAQIAAHQKQQEWVDSFRNTLNRRNWSESKKQDIVQQFDIVELDNGDSTEMWKYKFDAIWQDPESTQVFMDFLSDFDAYTLKFKRNGVPSTKQVSSTIQNIINAKNQNKSKSQHLDQRQTSSNIKTIDPRNM